jgi:hypothetical protein
VKYAYISRPTNEKDEYTFVADADALDPFLKKDANYDGKIDEADELNYPGESYHGITYPNELREPVTLTDPFTDRWGTILAGSAPIKDETGTTVALLGVDVFADELNELTLSPLVIISCFFGLFFLFILIRLAAFNRSLLQETVQMLCNRKAVLTLGLCCEVAFFLTLGLYYYNLNLVKTSVGTRLMSIASTVAPEFDADDLNQLHFAKDMKTDAYQRVFQKLSDIKKNNPDVKWAYIQRRTETSDLLEFVADADSNYTIPFFVDANGDGIPQKEEENVAPGIRIALEDVTRSLEAFDHPTYERNFQMTQWDALLSGFAPIKDKNGTSVAILGLDQDVTSVYDAVNARFKPWLWFMGIAAFLLFFRVVLRWM